jgi:hypothetical protein
MRAVSLARGVVGARAGAGGGRGAGTGAPDLVQSAEATVFWPLAEEAVVLSVAAIPRAVQATAPAGGVGNGFCDTGGLGIGTLAGFATSGTDMGGGSEAGGRDGRLIRTVSSSSGAAASPRRGGRVIRTVSFFGSLASAMVTLKVE